MTINAKCLIVVTVVLLIALCVCQEGIAMGKHSKEHNCEENTQWCDGCQDTVCIVCGHKIH